MKKIIVIGASGHARVIIDIIEKQGVYEIFGLVDSFKTIGSKIYNYSILGTEKDIPYLVKNHDILGGIIAIGDNFTRMSMYHEILSYNLNFQFISAIHPDAIIAKNITFGEGTCVMAGVIINSDVTIGKQCIINTKSSIDHEVIIHDFSSVSPGVTIGGLSNIDKCTAISIGATVFEGVKIGKYTVIGACSMVNRDIGDNKLAYGIPVKEIANRNSNDRYLGTNKTQKDTKYELNLHKIRSTLDKKKYQDIVNSIDTKNIFYSLEYCNYSEKKTLNYFVLKINNKNKIIMPFYLTKVNTTTSPHTKTYYDVTSPYGYSGPLYKNITSENLTLFWKKVDQWYKKNNVVTEFIRFNLNNNHKYYSGNLIPSLKNVRGALTSYDSIWGNLKQKVRNNYRKADKNNLKATFYNENIDNNIIDSFYNIYTSTMLRKNASKNYFYSKDYFNELIKNNSKKIAIVLIHKDKIAISAELLILCNDTIYSHLGGTLSEYFDLRPNDFLKIETTKWGIENGKSHYVLGGGRKDYDGLYNYKKAFFPKEQDSTFYTGRKIINYDIYKKLAGGNLKNNSDINILINDPESYFPIYKKLQINDPVFLTERIE